MAHSGALLVEKDGNTYQALVSLLPKMPNAQTPRPQNVVLPGTMPIPDGPMQTLVMDFAGPFPTTSRGNKYILGIFCPFAKWPICVPLPSRTASGVTRALIEHVIQNYSAPRFILTDNAKEFIGKKMKNFCRVFGVKQLLTKPYTAQLNPFIERYHRIQSACLTILSSKYKNDWDLALPLVTMAYRQSVHTSTGYTPHEVMFGRAPRGQLDHVFDEKAQPTTTPDHVCKLQQGLAEIHKNVQKAIKRSAELNLDRRDALFREITYKPGDWVLVHSPKASEKLPKSVKRKPNMVDQWSEPCRVVCTGKRSGYYVVRDAKGLLQDVRADSMVDYKFYFDNLPAMPPRPRFTARERTVLADDAAAYVPPEIKKDMLVVFPMTLKDGSPGFGVGKAIARLGRTKNWNCQWYSNAEETIDDVFLPCWLNSNGRWYAAETKKSHDKPLCTHRVYQGNINERTIADAGFRLMADHKLPHEVLSRIHKNPRFAWTFPENQ